MTFRGLHEHNLDPKDRITVPSEYRTALAEGIVLMKGVEPCVEVWPAAEAEEMEAATLAQLNPLSRDARRLQRRTFAHSVSSKLDSNGRILLPKMLLEHGELDGRCVIAGMGKKLEIWSPDQWLAEDEENEKQAPALTESLAAQQAAAQGMLPGGRG
jgi:MraZ protein